MIQGNDGGANVSLNGGYTWSTIYNQPTAQFYHSPPTTATLLRLRHPAGQHQRRRAQPHQSRRRSPGAIATSPAPARAATSPSAPTTRTSSMSARSAPRPAAATASSATTTHRPDPPDHHLAGDDGRLWRRRAQVSLRLDLPDRHLARTIPTRSTSAATRSSRARTKGRAGKPISPDLTRADPETLQPTGGPVNRDSIGAETYATVFAFAESPHEAGVFWAGSDDGRAPHQP